MEEWLIYFTCCVADVMDMLSDSVITRALIALRWWSLQIDLLSCFAVGSVYHVASSRQRNLSSGELVRIWSRWKCVTDLLPELMSSCQVVSRPQDALLRRGTVCLLRPDSDWRGRMSSHWLLLQGLLISVLCCLCWYQFLPARRYASAGNRHSNVSIRPSVCHSLVLCQNEES